MTGTTIYRGEGLVKRWGDSSSALRTVTLQLQEDEPLARHPFFGFDGRRVAIVVVELDETMGGAPTRKDGAGVGTTGATSANVVPTPPAKPGPQPSLTTGPATGGAAQTQSASAAPPKPNSTRAVMMAKDPEFWRFLSEQYRGGLKLVDSEESADRAIKFLCNVQSKSELNDRPKAAAAAAFDRLRNDFKTWRQSASAHV